MPREDQMLGFLQNCILQTCLQRQEIPENNHRPLSSQDDISISQRYPNWNPNLYLNIGVESSLIRKDSFDNHWKAVPINVGKLFCCKM